MINKKIIGYKCPIDLFDGASPKGSLYILYSANHSYYEYTPPIPSSKLYLVPKEIVETWEPVYENKFPMKFEEIKAIFGYFIRSEGNIVHSPYNGVHAIECHKNMFATTELAHAALAIAQLSQLHKAWLEIEPLHGSCMVIKHDADKKLDVIGYLTEDRYKAYLLVFNTREAAELFLETFKDLLEIAKPLLK